MYVRSLYQHCRRTHRDAEIDYNPAFELMGWKLQPRICADGLIYVIFVTT